jgi:hypothetical protein
MDSVMGTRLFNDIEDVKLRDRNRGVVMANFYEDNMDKSKRMNQKGFNMLAAYYRAIPEDERPAAYNGMFVELCKRGIATKH